MAKFDLIRNIDFGYFSVCPMPTEKELNDFYEAIYYQKDTGQYSKAYSKIETEYFQIDCRVLERLYASTFPESNRKAFLDIGCGEGYQANYFYEKKWEITCADYSDFGLKIHHPHLIDKLIKGNFEEMVDQLINSTSQHSIILLKNVLEHVINPLETLQQIKRIMDKETLLCIDVPNDYSDFQTYLSEKDYTGNTWFNPPQHLHYFQFDSLKKLLEAQGLEIVSRQAGFPIELFLLNSHSNYAKNRSLGKEAHLARCKAATFLSNADIEKFIRLREVHADLSFGRDIVMIVKLKA